MLCAAVIERFDMAGAVLYPRDAACENHVTSWKYRSFTHRRAGRPLTNLKLGPLAGDSLCTSCEIITESPSWTN